MIAYRKSPLLAFSLIVALLLSACAGGAVSVAPSATPSPEPLTADTATPISTATQAPTEAATAPEPAAPESRSPTTSSEVPRLSAVDLKSRLDNGEAILVVDSRAATAFESQHITGAISVPLSEVESRLDEFPRDQEIVFYCT